MALNASILQGRLGKDPELRTVGDSNVANFSIAISKKVKGEERTSWFDLSAWGKTAEIIGQYLRKGDEAIFECEAEQRSWEKDGQTRSKVEFRVHRMHFCGKGEQRQDTPQFQGGGTPTPPPAPDDDIPFMCRPSELF